MMSGLGDERRGPPAGNSHRSLRLDAVATVVLAVATLAGCGDDFEKPSLVKGLRVLAVQAEPPSVSPDGVTMITPLVHADDPAAIEREWSLCAITKGPTTGYECAVDELPLGKGETVPVDVAPLVALAEQAAQGTGYELDLESGETFFVRLVVTAGDERVEAVKRVTVTTTEPRNTNPAIAALLLDGKPWPQDEVAVVAPGAVIRVVPQATKSSVEPTVDASGAESREELLYAWFATAGEMDKVFSYDDIPENEWTAPQLDAGDDERAVTLWVVVRDGRGGTGWTERALRVTAKGGGE